MRRQLRVVDNCATCLICLWCSTSRLHFIGTWRDNVQRIVREAISKRKHEFKKRNHTRNCSVTGSLDVSPPDDGDNMESASFPGPGPGLVQGPPRYVNPTSARRERVIVHIDMDCFFASVALLTRPHLRNAPVAVAHSGPLHGPWDTTSGSNSPPSFRMSVVVFSFRWCGWGWRRSRW